jgi:hypothetical protein
MTDPNDTDEGIPALGGSGGTEAWGKILGFLLVWGMAINGALYFVTASNLHDPRLWKKPGYSLEFGYTWSLILLYLPLAVLFWWYRLSLRSDGDGSLRALMKGVLYNTALAAAVFVLFDVIFAELLFNFPDHNAVLGHSPYRLIRAVAYVPGYKWDDSCATIWTLYRASCYSLSIPVEEVLFYLGGAAVLRGMYIWASEDFLSLYTVPPAEYERRAKASRRLIKWNWSLTFLALAIVVAGFVFKRRYGGGIPTYLLLQVLIVFPPLLVLHTRVRPFINTRAFLLVMLLQVLVSVVWEATLALPYGWWGYKEYGVIGRAITPWSALPVEASFFWISVGWSAMFLHEATKIKVRSGRRWWQVLTGSNDGYSVRGLAGRPPRGAKRISVEL